MWYKEDNFSVIIGGNKYINVPNILVYKGDPIFKITRAKSSDQLGIDFDIYDSKKNKIAVVRNGRIYKGDKDKYAVEILSDRYTLTDNVTGKILCSIRKRSAAGNSELDVVVQLYMKDGFLFEATPNKTNIGSNTLIGCTISNCPNGIVIN